MKYDTEVLWHDAWKPEWSIARQRLATNTFPWQRMEAVVDLLFEMVVSLRFVLSYKRQFIREFIVEAGRMAPP
jgi:hypothetical protein